MYAMSLEYTPATILNKITLDNNRINARNSFQCELIIVNALILDKTNNYRTYDMYPWMFLIEMIEPIFYDVPLGLHVKWIYQFHMPY